MADYIRWHEIGEWKNLPDISTPASAEFLEHIETGVFTAQARADAAYALGGGGISDGDKGEVTVTGGAWAVDPTHAGSSHASVQSAAEATAATDATNKVTAHSAAADPHADRAFTTTAVSNHAAAVDPHADRAFATTAVSDHVAAADPHGDRAFSVQRANHSGSQAQGTITNLTTDLGLLAPKASPTFTGTVTIPNGAVLGTPLSGLLTNLTGLPVATGISGLAAGVATLLATPSSANLLAALTDKTGTGVNVFGTSPTIVTPTIASFTNAAHTHADAAGGGTLDHGTAITGLTDDDHTQYGLLAGRSGGQTIIGGTASNNRLTLSSNSVDPQISNILLSSPLQFFAGNQTLTAKPNSLISLTNTYTLNFDSASFGGNTSSFITLNPTLIIADVTTPPTKVGIGYTFGGVIKNDPAIDIDFGQFAALRSTPTFTADNQAILLTATADLYSEPTFNRVGTGTMTMTSDYVNFESNAIIGTGVTFSGTYAAFGVLPPTVTGTLQKMCGLRVGSSSAPTVENFGVQIGFNGTGWGGAGANIGLYIQTAPTGGTTNTGIHNAGTIRQIGAAVFGISAEPTAGYGIEVRSGSLGYGVGCGGTATQLTSKATGVTINKQCGAITLNAAALAANTTVNFTFTNSVIGANDLCLFNHESAGTAGAYNFNSQCGVGSALVSVRNVTAGSLSEAIVVSFMVFKGAIT